MTLKEIQKIIKDFEESELTELSLEFDDVKLRLSKNKVSEVISNKTEEIKENIKENNDVKPEINLPLEEIKSPLVGTFYSANNPEGEPFIKVGQKIKKGDSLCIIEAMKIMNEITSSVDGIVEKIHYENGEVVGFNDVVVTVKKDGI
ncbi:acetyl-CoA carboxylase biotin carboxyl carrier protein [Haploplasma modicum]|jgi:acetyl-CoA carboxylase biotin carboxyl carrier protein|uniref:acetyl-CoA carboxylase biotin carboxyl carrier protein n=1 Tax=Haploplasma modicum TaxID=2150 RepID=UPI00047E4C94|nr:biotin/lipoyl-containing protein [Haploplasma modicum]